jgi:hypothetical protein
MYSHTKEFTHATLAVMLVLTASFVALEPQISGAASNQDQHVLTQNVTEGISINITSNTASMNPDLSLTENVSATFFRMTVTTNAQAGYSMSVTASSTAGCTDHDGQGVPDALCDPVTGESFNDLSTTTRQLWATATSTGGDGYFFGFSAGGNDVSGFGSGGQFCTSNGLPYPDKLYQGFDGENTSYEIASTTSETSTSGSVSRLCLAAEQVNVFAPSGVYYATTTVTAMTN